MSIDVRADWDDLDAAVDVAQEWAELGLLRAKRGERRSVYTFITVREEPATLIAERVGGGRIRLSASAGRAGGDEEQSARLLRAVARRLGQLEGVDVAPVE